MSKRDREQHYKLTLLITLYSILLFAPFLRAETVLEQAYRYQELFLETCYANIAHKSNAYCAHYAAQIETESMWDSDAVSIAGAGGLAQIMPVTARDIESRSRYKDIDVFNPAQALPAMLWYVNSLHRVIRGHTEYDRQCMTDKSYNGGLGWLRRDQRIAMDRLSCESVNTVNAGRHDMAWIENHDYPIKIRSKSYKYAQAGWGDIP